MALQIEYTDAHGVTHPAAYGRINAVILRREINQPAAADYVVEIFASADTRGAACKPLAAVGGTMPIPDDDGTLGLAQLYAHAHTLPEFADAQDVI